MNNIKSIAFALEPTNVPAFLLDWEVTKKCNLDCSYCGTLKEWGLHAGHDPSAKHPLLEDCLKTIDFMYQYVDLYMRYKKPSQRKVVLNVYGGESLYHPDIVAILTACRERYQQYKDAWVLTITCTTNAVIGKTLWEQVVPLIDEFTVSYHPENLPKQKQQFKDNILYLKANNKRQKCVVLMHNDPELFADSERMVEFCQLHDIRAVPKALDNAEPEWAYNPDQFNKLKTFWINRVSDKQKTNYAIQITPIGQKNKIQSIEEGRACCGGRKLSLNSDLKSSVGFVPRQGFNGWSCSVNWFFLFVRQYDGAVYTNKDCETSTTGQIEPLGNLDNTEVIIDTLRTQLETGTMPIIKCIKDICRCGFCAPKAETQEEFLELIKRNVPVDIFQTTC
jgi:pyruvate-formate lyase-activating enzyme